MVSCAPGVIPNVPTLTELREPPRPAFAKGFGACRVIRVHHHERAHFFASVFQLSSHFERDDTTDAVANKAIRSMRLNCTNFRQVIHHHLLNAFVRRNDAVCTARPQTKKSESFADKVYESRVNEKFVVAAVSARQKENRLTVLVSIQRKQILLRRMCSTIARLT